MIEGPGCECQPVCPPGAIVLCTTQMSEEPLVFSFTSSVFTSISGSTDACTISMVLIPCPIVAHATLHAMRTQPTNTPADVSFTFFVLMVSLLWSALQWRDIAAGAQSERWERCWAGECPSLPLGLAGRFFGCRQSSVISRQLPR